MIHALLTAVVAATGWSAPQVLSNGAIALGPELSMASSGAAIAVWDHELGPDCAQSPASLTCAHIVEFSERPSALGWSSPRELARPGIGARPQAAVNDAGRAAVIWVHDIGRDRVVQATYRTGADEAFPNPNDLSAAVLEVEEHHVGLDAAGNAAVVWAERHDQTFDVAGDMRSVSGGGWRAPVVLSRGAVAEGPALAVTPQGDAYALWIERAEVYVAHGDLRQGTWDDPVSLGAPGAQVAGSPVVAADAAGNVVAAWSRLDRPGGQAVVRAAYKAAAQDWHVDELGPGMVQDVALAPTGVAAVTSNGANGELSASIRPVGGPWSAPQRIAARGTESRIALSPHNDAVVVFRQGPELMTALRPASAATWQPIEHLSDGDPTSTDIGLDAAGNGSAVWNVGTGDSLPVMTSTFSEEGWTPTLASTRRPAIVGRPVVGRTVACTRGVWAGTVPISYAYRWLRNGRAVRSARTYRILRRDVGARLACRVSATNAARTLTATSAPVRVR